MGCKNEEIFSEILFNWTAIVKGKIMINVWRAVQGTDI